MANNDSRYPEIEILKKDFCNPKFIQSLTRKQAAQEKKEKEYIAEVKTKEYMNWLVNTVKVNGYVSDSPSFPLPNKTKEDSDKIKKISYLYRVIDDYASDNYYPDVQSYNVKYEDTILEFRLFMSQGGMCMIRESNESKDFLLYDDIVSNKESDRKSRISKELNEYKEYLSRLLNDDVPEQALVDALDDTIGAFRKKR